MRVTRNVVLLVLLPTTLLVPCSSGATTLVRQGLEVLTSQNAVIVRGKVLDLNAHWNAGHNFILTDVHIRPTEVFKGASSLDDLTFTVLGGTVGSITTLVIGTPELVPGSTYLLFLNREDLPGATQRLTVRDLVQGAFDVVRGRAISQAAHFPLLADTRGLIEPPGGAEGMPVEEMVQRVHEVLGQR